MVEQRYVFIASSIVEFERERKKIQALGSSFVPLLAKAEPYVSFVVDVCENASSRVVLSGKQAEYNEQIRRDDLFVVIAGEKLGEYTLEEVQVAVEAYNHRKEVLAGDPGAPSVNVGPRMLLGLVKRSGAPEDSSIAEMRRLMGECDGSRIIEWDTVDEVKAAIVQALNDIDLLPVKAAYDARGMLYAI